MGRWATSARAPGILLALVALALGALVALTAPACDDALVCEGPENCPGDSACVDGLCRLRSCFADTDCPMEQYCDLEVGQCDAGCRTDRDCYYGFTCTGGSCSRKACTSTALDCDAGQYCDVYTGECFDGGGPLCHSCTSDEDCGGGGNQCWYISGEGPYCLTPCDASRPCPAGYSCIPISSQGSVTGHLCATLCNVLQDASPAEGLTGARALPTAGATAGGGAGAHP